MKRCVWLLGVVVLIYALLFPLQGSARAFTSSYSDFYGFFKSPSSLYAPFQFNHSYSSSFWRGASNYQNSFGYLNKYQYGSFGGTSCIDSLFGYRFPFSSISPSTFTSPFKCASSASCSYSNKWLPAIPVVSPSQKAPRSPRLEYRVETDATVYDPHETVSITFGATNKGDEAVDIEFASGKQFDVIIANDEGGDVYQHSLHMDYVDAETTLTINPGETKVFEAQWDQRDDEGEWVPLGSYTIRAFLTPKDTQYKKVAFAHIGIRELPTFTDCEELWEKLKEARVCKKSPVVKTYSPVIPWYTPLFGGYTYTSYGMAMNYAVGSYGGGYSYTPQSSSSTSDTTEYSTTNTQVSGVDEADVVKNDGSYIYTIKGDTVRIVSALTVGDLEEVGSIAFENTRFTPEQLYVDGDILVVIGKETRTSPFYYPKWHPKRYKIFYYPRASYTRVYIYDITDRANPEMTRTVKFEARFLQSRKVDTTLYLVMDAQPPYCMLDKDLSDPSVLLPIFSDSSIDGEDEGQAVVDCCQVAFFPGYTEPNYLVVAAIPVHDRTKEIGRTLILGRSENVFCSRENLYVTSSSYLDEGFAIPSPENPKVIIRPSFRSSQGTIIYKFALSGESVEYVGKAIVAGRVIDQFCMDECDGHFSIFTTTSSPTSNNLYVLDADLRLAGVLEGFGDGERIKSVRFMEDRAYVVTYRVIDPFFVVSLEDYTHPEILGELKISGYTEYLHPYDLNHIVGFGREVQNNRELGLKISLFEVTDVTNPVELHTEVIGDAGSDSEVLKDHRALLFSAPRHIMAFPVTVTERRSNCCCSYKYVFQGAYFYYIDEFGFEFESQQTHCEEGTFPSTCLSPTDELIRRVLYIDDQFYTVSEGMIKAFDMETYDETDMLVLD